MNWNAVGAVGKIMGSLATFVTVGFLFVQVHDSERQMQSAATDNRAATIRQLWLAQLTDERLMSIIEKTTPPPPDFDALVKRVEQFLCDAIHADVSPF